MTDRYPLAAVLADPHWSTQTPEYRKEKVPFHTVIGAKLSKAAAYCKNMEIPLLIAGDLFDRSREFLDMWTAQEFFWDNFFSSSGPGDSGVRIYAVPGQHDMFHHNPNDPATSLNMLRRRHGSLLTLLGSEHRIFLGEFCVYGAGYGEEVPIPIDRNAKNVLIWHKGLWHRTPMFPGQTEGNVAAESVRLSELGYKIVFSGDNHRAFDAEVGGVRFCNLGAFTRGDVTLRDQQPRFCVLMSDGLIESHFVGEENVFDLERSSADKDHLSNKDEFSQALAGGFEHGATFKGSLETVARSGKCGELVLNKRQCALLTDIIVQI